MHWMRRRETQEFDVTIRQLELPRFYVRVVESRDQRLRDFRVLVFNMSRENLDVFGPPHDCHLRCRFCGRESDDVNFMIDHVALHSGQVLPA